MLPTGSETLIYLPVRSPRFARLRTDGALRGFSSSPRWKIIYKKEGLDLLLLENGIRNQTFLMRIEFEENGFKANVLKFGHNISVSPKYYFPHGIEKQET
jgi:hypothetical protein